MIEHEDMIGRYLDGQLPPEARLEFERLMEGDSVLAREVRAEGAIRRTLLNDYVPLPGTVTEPSSAIMAKLSATPGSAGGTLVQGLTGTAAGTAAGAGFSTILGAIFGTTLGVGILSVVGVAGIVLGIFLIAPLLREPDPTDRAGQNIIPIPQVSSPSGISSPSAGKPAGTPSANEVSPSSESKVESPRKELKASGNASQTNVQSQSAKGSGRGNDGTTKEAAAQSDHAKKSDEMMRYLRRRKEAETPRIVRKDSLKLKLEVEK